MSDALTPDVLKELAKYVVNHKENNQKTIDWNAAYADLLHLFMSLPEDADQTPVRRRYKYLTRVQSQMRLYI